MSINRPDPALGMNFFEFERALLRLKEELGVQTVQAPASERVGAPIGVRLREERQRLGLNQADFAAIGGVRKLAQFNYEADKRQPDKAYLVALAARGVDVHYVLTGERMPDVLRDNVRAAAQLTLNTIECEDALIPFQAPASEGVGAQIGARLREERERLLWSQQGLSNACAVTMRTQRNYELGQRLPNAAYLAAANAAGIDVHFVLTGQRTRTPPAGRLGKPDYGRDLRALRYTDPRVVLLSVPVGIMDDRIDVVGDPDNAAYEWVIVRQGRVFDHSDAGYGSPEVALRDGLLSYLGPPTPVKPAPAEAIPGLQVTEVTDPAGQDRILREVLGRQPA